MGDPTEPGPIPMPGRGGGPGMGGGPGGIHLPCCAILLRISRLTPQRRMHRAGPWMRRILASFQGAPDLVRKRLGGNPSTLER